MWLMSLIADRSPNRNAIEFEPVTQFIIEKPGPREIVVRALFVSIRAATERERIVVYFLANSSANRPIVQRALMSCSGRNPISPSCVLYRMASIPKGPT